MLLHNDMDISLLCSVEGKEAVSVPPRGSIPISGLGDTALLRLSMTSGSRVGDTFDWEGMNIIALESQVRLSQLDEDSACHITGERVHFEAGHCYERLFCRCGGCRLDSHTLTAQTTEAFCKKAVRDKGRIPWWMYLLDFFLDGGFGVGTVVFLLMKAANWSSLSWWWLPACWVAGYVLVVLEDKLIGIVPKRVKKRRRAELDRYLDPEYIRRYYEDENRRWFGNDRIWL